MVLALGFLEGAAQIAEALQIQERDYPTPGPGIYEEFQAQTVRAREEVGTHVQMIPDDTREWVLPQGKLEVADGKTSIRVNSLNMRGPELPEPHPGDLRLLSLGDSTIFGTGVWEEEVFSAVAARELSSRWNRNVIGVNGGVPGYTTEQSLSFLEEIEGYVNPSWIVVGNIWSDVYFEDIAHTRFIEHVSRIDGPLNKLATYRLLFQGLAPWSRARRVRWISSREDIGQDITGDLCRVPLHQYKTNLTRMADMARDMGARTAYLLLPAPMDLDRRTLPPETLMEYREALRQVAQDLGAPLVDGPALLEEADAGLECFVDQVHMSYIGHAIIGQGLADALADQPLPRPGWSLYPTPEDTPPE